MLLGRRRATTLRRGEFWALQDVSFEVSRGEVVGLVGPNGAGKTTLLKVVCGLITPETGSVAVRGRLVPMLALGAGFNGVLSGLENVQLNLSILGLTSAEIARCLDAVIAFADLGDAIAAPVQTYSSGMVARLGFAAAVHASPDILLMDEVLAVGDAQFRGKCYRRLAELREQGVSTVIVSHSPVAILSICSSAMYLSGGKVIARGTPAAVLDRYDADLAPGGRSDGQLAVTNGQRQTGVEITHLGLRDAQGERVANLTSGAPGALWVVACAREPVADLSLNVIVREPSGGDAILALSAGRDGHLLNAPAGEFTVRLQLPHCALRPGTYMVKASLSKGGSSDVLDACESFVFAVRAGPNGFEGGLFHQQRTWSIV